MADVTVKQLAQVVGVPVERLLSQLKEAGLSITDELQTINEDQKRTLLSHLKSASTGKVNLSGSITLRRKSLSQVTLGPDAHSSKTVNIEVRKKRTYVKRNPSAEELLPETAAIHIEPVQEANQALTEEAGMLKSNLPDLDAPPSMDLLAETMPAPTLPLDDIEPQVIPLEPVLVEGLSLATVEENVVVEPTTEEAKIDKTAKKKPAVKEEPEAVRSEFKRAKKKIKFQSGSMEEADVDLGLSGKRHKPKKRKSNEKSDKYRQAEESLTHGFAMPTSPVIREVFIPESITVADLAKRMSVKVAEVIKVMISLGAMATINQVIDQETAVIVVEEMGHLPRLLKEDAIEFNLDKAFNQGTHIVSRAPVVTIMGHVDHGKTSLLDYIRRTKVAAGEAGGITQHIGAYHVDTPKGSVTFLDTPGHAAFTAMRARGAQATDIVVLIVAADDGVKPQTVEAVQHAKAALVPIIVAINKMDKEGADPERVMHELSVHGVMPESWGGEAIFVPISAKSGFGVDDLLDAIVLQAEVLELTANIDGSAKGVVIESRLDKGRGPVATVLVKSGTLHKGDIVLAGFQYGRVRALVSDSGAQVDSALPSVPVEILGFSAIPHAGDEVIVVSDEKKAREVALFRQGKFRDVHLAKRQKTSAEGIFDTMTAIEMGALNIVLKADVQGSVEAIADALVKLSNEEVNVKIIASGVGGITESDINLANASHALMIGFNVRADAAAKRVADTEAISIRYYSVIYDIVEEVKSALTGMLTPKFKEEIIGIAEVRDVFRSPKIGAIAGCMVIEGLIKRNNLIRVLRDSVVIYEGTLESLRRFKDDVLEVRQGFECGIGVKNYNDVRTGDLIEVFETIEIKRQL